MKKIWITLLAVLMLVGLCACGDSDTTTAGDDNSSPVSSSDTTKDNDSKDDDKEDEPVDISRVKLEEGQGITSEGVVFDETLMLNGYEFTLRSDAEAFLAGTGATVKNADEFEAFKTSDKTLPKEFDCVIDDNGREVEFSIKVSRNDEGALLLREINVQTDIKYAGSDFLANPNLVTCGFRFLGCDIEKNQFLDLPEELVKLGEQKTTDYDKEYRLTMRSARGDYWEIKVAASTADKNGEQYYFDYVIVSSINY